MTTRPDWDEYFLTIAAAASLLPPGATRHGCVLVDRQNRIISMGYNGPVRGLIDDLVPRSRPEKYLWMIHAETNAVLFARQDLTGATAYITGPPCAHCAALLLHAGVRRIVCGNQFSQCITPDEAAAVREMCRQLDVPLLVPPEPPIDGAAHA